jgi:D-sedoheptulose 7-phosphate isomerase
MQNSDNCQMNSSHFVAACDGLCTLIQTLRKDEDFRQMIDRAVAVCVSSLRDGGTVFFCGNGGSAADSQHLAGELVSRFLYDRSPLRGVALNADTAILTAIGNDYGYDCTLSRPLEAQARKGDVLIALSTSGRSGNVLAALRSAAMLGVYTVGLTGRDGGQMGSLCELELRVPSDSTPRIQEMHLLLGHVICEGIEAAMFPKRPSHS